MRRPIDEAIRRIGNKWCPCCTEDLVPYEDGGKTSYGCGVVEFGYFEEVCSVKDWKHCPLIHPWGDNPVQVD